MCFLIIFYGAGASKRLGQRVLCFFFFLSVYLFVSSLSCVDCFGRFNNNVYGQQIGVNFYFEILNLVKGNNE